MCEAGSSPTMTADRPGGAASFATCSATSARTDAAMDFPSMIRAVIPPPSLPVPEVTHPREDHRDPVLVRGGDHLVVPNRTARLDHRRDPRGCAGVQPVPEREERVRGHHGALRAVA